MVRWCCLEWKPVGECGNECVCVCVCVCLSKEKRKKMKERKERASQKRGVVGENEWWGMGLGGGHVGTKNNLILSFFFFSFNRWEVIIINCSSKAHTQHRLGRVIHNQMHK